jgi:hypothetical protein
MRAQLFRFAFWLLLSPAFAATLCGQDRVFEWQPANDETVRLDPANFHTGRTYHPGSNGGGIHVEIKSAKPVTIFLTGAEEWNAALRQPEMIGRLGRLCLREHVLDTVYLCDLPAQAMTLVVEDERSSPDGVVFAGLGAVLNPDSKIDRAIGAGINAVLAVRDSEARRFKSPNDVHIQYFRWVCVQYCIQPEFQWTRQVKEKYDLTSFIKVYGGFLPDHDGEQISIKIKSPLPMVVAVIPAEVANQLHSRPEALELALEKNVCQQRGAESLQFECTLNLSDGPQSLVVAPEPSIAVPKHKKAEIEWLAYRCVANCSVLSENQAQASPR